MWQKHAVTDLEVVFDSLKHSWIDAFPMSLLVTEDFPQSAQALQLWLAQAWPQPPWDLGTHHFLFLPSLGGDAAPAQGAASNIPRAANSLGAQIDFSSLQTSQAYPLSFYDGLWETFLSLRLILVFEAGMNTILALGSLTLSLDLS